MATAVAMETDDAGNRLRFQLELEFVQCLANPNYLNFLAQRGYFKDKAFVNYLKYLLYWKEPEYAKYLKNCIYFCYHSYLTPFKQNQTSVYMGASLRCKFNLSQNIPLLFMQAKIQ
ncbi:mediator of RNA polymerase II transcription subunit 31 isoform X2 [Grammomys surdaster]|uniref:mediator of RNA polymerase II transcription subunit 31 isoform X2 n=1 Tax=Grammomys surdaster TaxID=491861 RepID=UPI0010A057C3|nr:mediator of RNA polymerase II transcription subunit 31 isoform X2 [Grammomys surdaster]